MMKFDKTTIDEIYINDKDVNSLMKPIFFSILNDLSKWWQMMLEHDDQIWELWQSQSCIWAHTYKNVPIRTSLIC